MKYSDKQRLQKIYEYANRLCDCVKEKNIKKEDLLNDYSMQWLVTTPLYNIGEHVYYLSNEFKKTARQYRMEYNCRTQTQACA